MTHYYLYIRAGQTIDTDTRFYKVGIGESEAQRRKFAWLESYAFEHGHFFVIWSPDAADFMLKCQQSIGRDSSNIIALKAVELVRILRDGHAEPSTFQTNVNRHRLMMQIDPHYFCYHQLKEKQQRTTAVSNTNF